MNGHVLPTLVLGLLCCAGACDTESDGGDPGGDSTVVVDTVSSAPTPAGGAAQQPADSVAAVAARISDGVGVVSATAPRGDWRPVYVFEETHGSRIGQIEIAVMLNRLRERFGVRSVGLEGAYQRATPLDATWFHPLGGGAGRGTREDVAVRMLAQGDISSAEALALVFPDETVYGTERQDLYDRDSGSDTDAEPRYLLSIAESSLPPEQIRRVEQLMRQHRNRQAMAILMPEHSWVRAQFDSLRADTLGAAVTVSCEAMQRRLQTYRDTADARGVPVDATTRQEADSALVFYQVCQERSDAMVERVAQQIQSDGAPTAMVIGAGHTAGVMRLLQMRHIPYAVIRPVALFARESVLTPEQYQRKNRREWVQSSPGTLGEVLNRQVLAGGHKPPPVIETASAHGYASLLYAGNVIAAAARDGRRVPDDIASQLQNLPDCTIDPASFTASGYDVIFKATLNRTHGSAVDVWSRVGTDGGTAVSTEVKGLEPKLLQARSDLGGDRGGLPPRKPPAGTVAASGEGPGDGRRRNLIVARTGPRTLAVFASTRKRVMDAGRLST